MSETKWTAGLWSVCNDGECRCKQVWCPDFPLAKITNGNWGDDYPSIRIVGETSLELKAEAYMEQITYGEVSEEMATANALLIAAAPELYAALESVVAEMRREHDAGDGHFSTAQVEAAEAALAKARGEKS